jgi:hypothetical protein
MFPSDQLVAFVDHKDPAVSSYAAEYFLEAHDPAPATASLLWRAIDRLGAKRAHLGLLARLEHDDALWSRLLRELTHTEDPFVRGALLDAVYAAPAVPVLEAFRRLDRSDVVADVARERLQHRASLEEQPFDALWDALVRHCEAVGEAPHVPQEVPRDLVGALKRFPELAGPRCLEVFRSAPTLPWLHVHAIELAGAIRLSEAIAHLLDVIGGEGDYVNDRATDALVSIGSADVVLRVAERFPGGGSVFRMYAPAVLERIKRPESEAAVLELFRKEEDPFDRARFARGLFKLCTTEGFDDLHQLAIAPQPPDAVAEFEEWMMLLCTVQSRTVPELGRWRHEAAMRRAKTASKQVVAGKWRPTTKKKSKGRR